MMTETLCAVCLSGDKRLTTLNNNEEISYFKQNLMILDDMFHARVGFVNRMHSLCYECHMILRKCIKFNRQALESSKYIYNCLLKNEKPKIQLTRLKLSHIELYSNVNADVQMCEYNNIKVENNWCDTWSEHNDSDVDDTQRKTKIINKMENRIKVKLDRADKKFRTEKKDTRQGRRFECNQCDKTFKHRAGLFVHQQTQHKRNKFKCKYCEKVFKYRASLNVHTKLKHNAKQESERPKCVECDITFSSVCTYQRHIRLSLKHVTKDNHKFICDDCGKKYSNKTKLRDHIGEKHLKLTYNCHICYKPAKNRMCLDAHIRNVHIGRPNNKICHYCAKGFPTKVQLDSHLRSHTGERPFICEYCPTTFSQSSNLSKHYRQVHRYYTRPLQGVQY